MLGNMDFELVAR